MTWLAAVRLRPGAARLERDQQQRRTDPGLEVGDHGVSTRLGDAAVEERHGHLEALTEVAHQQLAHLAELGEHERPLADVEQLVDQLVEAGQLAGATGQAGPVAEHVDRVVADLLEPGQGGEHEAAPLHAGGRGGVGEQLVDDVLVQHGLLPGERGPRDLLDLVRQVRHQRAVGLGAPQDERLGDAPQPRRGVAVAVALDRLGEAVPEALPAAEHPGVDGVEDGPQVGQPVLDRRAGQGQLLAGPQGAQGLGRVGGRVLDELGLVGDDGRPVDGAEVLDVARQQPVGGHHEVGTGHLLLGPLGAVVHDDAQRRREAVGLGLPVVDDGQGAHDEVRTRPFEQVGQRGGGLAEAHVVGQAPAEPEAVEEPQPGQAAPLVRPQLAHEPVRLVLLPQALVGQAGEQLVGPSRHLGGRTARHAGGQLAVAGQAQQRHRIDDGVLADVVLQALAGPAHRGRVDAHPAPPAVQQRGPGPLGPFQLGVGDGRRPVVVGDDQLPLDDRLAPEPLPVIGGVGRGGPAADGDAGPDEALGSDQLDATRRQLGRRLLEEPLGVLDRQLEAGRLVLRGRDRRRRRRTRRRRRPGPRSRSPDAPGARCRPPPRRRARWRPTRPRPSTTARVRARRPARDGSPSRRRGRPARRDGPGGGRPARRAAAGRGARSGRRAQPTRRGGPGRCRRSAGPATPGPAAPIAPPTSPGRAQLGSGGRNSRSANRWRARASTIAAWMSATVVGSSGAGMQIGGIAAARASSAASTTTSATGTQRATVRSRSVRMLGATSPAATVEVARRATAPNQATASPAGARTGSERSQRIERSAGSLTAAGRMVSPSGSSTSIEDR